MKTIFKFTQYIRAFPTFGCSLLFLLPAAIAQTNVPVEPTALERAYEDYVIRQTLGAAQTMAIMAQLTVMENAVQGIALDSGLSDQIDPSPTVARISVNTQGVIQVTGGEKAHGVQLYLVPYDEHGPLTNKGRVQGEIRWGCYSPHNAVNPQQLPADCRSTDLANMYLLRP